MWNDSLRRPVFIVGGARSGTTMLHMLLGASPHLWSAYRELHGLYEWDIGLHPRLAEGQSNLLTAADATPERRRAVRRALRRAVSNREWMGWPSRRMGRSALWIGRGTRVANWVLPVSPIVVDKNPKHCFRVDFLRAVFPDARFVFLLRDARSNIHSLLEGWESQSYLTYDVRGTGCKYPRWSFDLPPGWRDWADRDLPELCARQWVGYNEAIVAAQAQVPGDQQRQVRYEDLLRDPPAELARILDWLRIPLDGEARRMAASVPVTNATSAPHPDKWLRRQEEILSQAHIYGSLLARLGYDASVTS